MGITIHPATSTDWPTIWELMRPILRAGKTFSWKLDVDETDARAIWYHDPPGRTVVAKDEAGTVVGTAESEPNHGGPGAHVATAGFMVHPHWQGRGIGRALCTYVLAQAKADGYRAMQFNAVAETNKRAVNLWCSLGFEIVGTVPEGFHHPTEGYVGLHVMHRRL